MEADRDFFFGRRADERIISANLSSARLTIFYGESGVGKTSVLLAGVVPTLRLKGHTAVVVYREWQDASFVNKLKLKCIESIEVAQRKPISIDMERPFDDFLYAAAEAFGGSILLIFDQFEEYFLNRPELETGNSFDAEFARAVNREEVDANFLISLREDSLSKLDRFEARIPTLLTNTLRLEHLDKDAAEEAIRKPIEKYNLQFPNAKAVSIEDDLVNAVLNQVQRGKVQFGDARGTGEVRNTDKGARIETPFLQLVMTRLWKEEERRDSRILRFSTFQRLGGAQVIVRNHLDDVMKKLNSKGQEVCARIFDRLVTPSGNKISYLEKDLTNYAGDLAAEVPSVLKHLTDADARILHRSETSGDGPPKARYEIVHDVLAQAVLDWRERFTLDQARAQDARRRRAVYLQVAAVFVLLAIFFVSRYYSLWLQARPWAYLTDLATGLMYELKGEVASVGRSTPAFKNLVNLNVPEQTVSRLHLLITRDRVGIDARSSNGTTVNAEFLQYGKERKLQTGDIIVLAGIAPFRFSPVEYSSFQFWTPSIENGVPASGWGILIDGGSRTVTNLDAEQSFLSIDGQNRLVLKRTQTDDTLLIIRRDNRGVVTIEDRDDGIDLLATMKEGDYDYAKYRLRPGIEYPFIRTEREDHDLFEVSYSYKGIPFQIVLVQKQ